MLALVMVGNDHVDAKGPGVLRLLYGGNAAVHRHHQAHPLGLQGIQSGAVEAIALLVPIRDIGDAVEAPGTEVVRHKAGGGNAVHIIVAVHGHGLAPADGLQDALPGQPHTGHQHGVMDAVRPAIDQLPGLLGILHPTEGQHGGQQRGEAGRRQLRRDPGPGKGYLPVLLFFHTLSTSLKIILIIDYT